MLLTVAPLSLAPHELPDQCRVCLGRRRTGAELTPARCPCLPPPRQPVRSAAQKHTADWHMIIHAPVTCQVTCDPSSASQMARSGRATLPHAAKPPPFVPAHHLPQERPARPATRPKWRGRAPPPSCPPLHPSRAQRLHPSRAQRLHPLSRAAAPPPLPRTGEGSRGEGYHKDPPEGGALSPGSCPEVPALKTGRGWRGICGNQCPSVAQPRRGWRGTCGNLCLSVAKPGGAGGAPAAICAYLWPSQGGPAGHLR